MPSTASTTPRAYGHLTSWPALTQGTPEGSPSPPTELDTTRVLITTGNLDGGVLHIEHRPDGGAWRTLRSFNAVGVYNLDSTEGPLRPIVRNPGPGTSVAISITSTPSK